MGRRRAAVSALAPVYKAVAATIATAVSATAAALGTAMADGDLTRPEVIVAIGAGLVAGSLGGGAVYAAPANRDA